MSRAALCRLSRRRPGTPHPGGAVAAQVHLFQAIGHQDLEDAEAPHLATPVSPVLPAADDEDAPAAVSIENLLQLLAAADHTRTGIEVADLAVDALYEHAGVLAADQPVIDAAEIIGLLQNILRDQDVVGCDVLAADELR